MASPDITPVESEWQVFRPALGIDIGTNAPTAVGVWRATTKQIDQVLADHGPDSRILTNMGSAFPVFLLTDRPGSFILDHDPDHEPTVAAGFRGIDIVFIAPGSTEGTLRAALGSDPSANWKATDAAVGTIYERRDSTPKR